MAVFTPLSLAQCQVFFRRRADFAAKISRIDPLTGGAENSTFRLEIASGLMALTLFENLNDPLRLKALVRFMQQMRESGLPVPSVRAFSRGMEDRLQNRFFLLADFLEGSPLADPDEEECRAGGALLAALHQAGAAMTSEVSAGEGRRKWAVPGRAAPAFWFADRIDGWLEAGRKAAAHMQALWPSGLPRSVIHGDYFPDNVLMAEGKISGLIDFEYVAEDFPAYDVAIALNAWCFDAGNHFNAGKARAFLRGYAARRPLTLPEEKALPVLAAGAALRFFLSRTGSVLARRDKSGRPPKDPQEFWDRYQFFLGLKETWRNGRKWMDD